MHNLKSIFQNVPGDMHPNHLVWHFKFLLQKMAKKCTIKSPFLQIFWGGGHVRGPKVWVLSFYGKNSSKMHNLESHFSKFSRGHASGPLIWVFKFLWQEISIKCTIFQPLTGGMSPPLPPSINTVAPKSKATQTNSVLLPITIN